MAETLVTFVKDSFPHVAGDVVKVDNDDLKKIDSSFYKKGAQDFVREEKPEVIAARERHEALKTRFEAEAAAKDVASAPVDATAQDLKEAKETATSPAPIDIAVDEVAQDEAAAAEAAANA